MSNDYELSFHILTSLFLVNIRNLSCNDYVSHVFSREKTYALYDNGPHSHIEYLGNALVLSVPFVKIISAYSYILFISQCNSSVYSFFSTFLSNFSQACEDSEYLYVLVKREM